MARLKEPLVSFVVPLYNEAVGLENFHESLEANAKKATEGSYEIIYCDDGSTDNTSVLVQSWHKTNPRLKLIKLSRNFGKENALAAGIAQAGGRAIMTLDGDGQHPVNLIPEFVEQWQKGNQVVIGVRSSSSGESWSKRLGSRLFYKLYNKTGERLVPRSTDFRLIDRTVAKAFLELKETDRMTRGLIDWLGFKRSFIKFEAKPRRGGSAGYSQRKLMRLFTHSFVSMTPVPLYLFGYLGIFITFGALLLGGSVFIEQILFNDPWHWNFTGTAMIGILILFLVGILLMAQGMLSLYISHIHSQTKSRPLYVIDYEGSAGVKKP